MLVDFRWLAGAAVRAVLRPRMDRQKSNVLTEYSAGWESYARYLDQCVTLDDWLKIRGVEDVISYCQVSGKVKCESFDSGEFNKRKILTTLQRDFPTAKSVTEYGCGIGRNLLFLKRQLPHLKCYGYELCKPGVELAAAAAQKFGLDVSYSQLDYVGGNESEYIFPKTDVSFTLFSLEQLPNTNKIAVENILRHTVYGSIHLEPVPEMYPFTLRGLIGRMDHWKANYLRNFERNISELANIVITRESINSSHNPLMFPTLYVIKKSQSSTVNVL